MSLQFENNAPPASAQRSGVLRANSAKTAETVDGLPAFPAVSTTETMQFYLISMNTWRPLYVYINPINGRSLQFKVFSLEAWSEV